MDKGMYVLLNKAWPLPYFLDGGLSLRRMYAFLHVAHNRNRNWVEVMTRESLFNCAISRPRMLL
jgi:hypothetical protein